MLRLSVWNVQFDMEHVKRSVSLALAVEEADITACHGEVGC